MALTHAGGRDARSSPVRSNSGQSIARADQLTTQLPPMASGRSLQPDRRGIKLSQTPRLARLRPKPEGGTRMARGCLSATTPSNADGMKMKANVNTKFHDPPREARPVMNTTLIFTSLRELPLDDVFQGEGHRSEPEQSGQPLGVRGGTGLPPGVEPASSPQRFRPMAVESTPTSLPAWNAQIELNH